MTIDPVSLIRSTPWTRQGEWGGTTLSRSLTYGGMQRAMGEWTGIHEGYESFLHSGETTYIATGQYERFARALLHHLERDRAPLRAFSTRFDRLLLEVEALLQTLKDEGQHDEKIARYFHLHQQMQPYSYVFGYGEDQVVGELLDRLLATSGLDDTQRLAVREAATSPLRDERATRTLDRARRDGVDARAMDFAHLVRRQLQVRTDRRLLWSKVEEAIRPHLSWRANQARLPMRYLQEATPHEILRELPPRAVLATRIGTTFLAHLGDIHLLTGADHEGVQAHLTPTPTPQGDLVGQVAFPGLVTGRVRIVLSATDADALQHGEILVSDMTTPELTTACSRAAAIVTDRGGILCHAALVAREMRIPCVLGTEHATRTLANGDLVEVDAGRGLVRKLEAGAAP